MLKKLIAYQRLLLNSTPPINMNSNNPLMVVTYICIIVAMTFMNMFIFMGNTASSNSILPIALPMISVWMINRIRYGDHRLFETVPVSREYIVFNVFLLSIVIMFIGYLAVLILSSTFIVVLLGIAYVFSPQGFIESPPASDVFQLIDTTKGDLLMLCILVIILFAGTAITFIISKKIRLLSFAGLVTIGYGLLFFLKLNMPIAPNSDKVEFLQSFSVMPQGTTILICVAIATVIICITSIFMGYNLYVHKSNYSQTANLV